MKRNFLSVTFSILTAVSLGSLSANAADFCKDWRSWSTFHSSTETPVSLVKLYGMAQFQVGYIDGTDSAGNSFNDSQSEFRRIWLGGDVRFLDGFLFKNVFSITQGKNAATGKQDIGFKHFRNLYLSYDFTKSPGSTLDFKRFEIGYGRRSLKLADEWQKSATHFDPVERSPFANKLWPTDEGGSHPVGVWVQASRGQNDMQVGVFSTTHDDEFPGWSDGTLLYGEWAHKLAGESNFKLREIVINGFTQGTSSADDKLARGLEWGASAILRLHRDDWEVNTTIGAGLNGEASNGAREGSFWGASITPMYWLVENKVKLVSRYQYQHASNTQGIRLNSRYARSADARGVADLSLTGGRGDRHHNLYFGINYFFCGDNLKLVSGVEYDNIQTAGGINVFKGWTASSALRLFF
jgi:hypothetical protein